ncbi:hypothetical protein NE237_031498 [Protea cynaroides]|uniref:FRIGIDA-like protein n=1 Tax=Protea cynaroides TaxID=273540 RepID=A0A9Q0L2K3_9MAGN|nr:hypothetical protein NE237_031498 [Protea cynaroides]
MASLKAISTALESVDSKKENLRKAFEDLQAHSSALASFTLLWKDLEEYLDSIKSSIEKRFKELELKESQSGDRLSEKESPPHNVDSNGKQSLSAIVPVKIEPQETETTPPPELLSLCLKMDGKGLRSYIIEHRRVLSLIRDDVTTALKSASDPAKIVLDAMQGLYPPNSRGSRDSELVALKTCIFLLERQAAISPKIQPEVKVKAKKLADEWKGKVSTGADDPLEIITFLQFIDAYDLVSAFRLDELLDLVVYIARRRQAIDLCRELGFTDKIPDLIQKLINKGKHLEAVKFVFAFGLVDKFPPVPLLKTYVKESKKLAQGIRRKGNDSIPSQNEASAREITALRAVIRVVEEHDLESEYSCESIQNRVDMLERQKAERKRNAVTTPDRQQSRNKRFRPSSPADAAPDVPKSMPPPSSTVSTIHQNQLLPTSLLPDRVAPYLGSAAGPYSLSGPSSISPYLRTSSELYGVGANPVGFGGHRSPPRYSLYSSESQPPSSGLYDRPLSYGTYGLPPEYRSSFYP